MNDEQAGSSGWTAANQVCRARMVGSSNLVECLAEVPNCQWHIPYGKGQLCSHIANQMIARGVSYAGWAPPADA